MKATEVRFGYSTVVYLKYNCGRVTVKKITTNQKACLSTMCLCNWLTKLVTVTANAKWQNTIQCAIYKRLT